MIPLKEEPKLKSALCFSDEDAEQLLSCQAAIAQAGNVVITAARHENLLAHYTRTMLAEINQGASRTVAIRRMPKTSDGLLDGLNEHLASLDMASLETKRVVKTREIWLYELPGPAQSDLLQMAAKMIGQFRAAGVSIIVHSRQARPDSQHLQKLAQRLRATHVVFQTPNEEQCRRLSESAKGCPEAAQINQLIRSLGVSIEHEEAGQLADLSSTSSLTQLMQEAEKSLPVMKKMPQPKNGSPVSVSRTKNKTATVNPAPSGVSNARILISSGIACMLIMGLYFSPNLDPYAAISNGVSGIQTEIAKALAPSTITEDQPVASQAIDLASPQAQPKTVPVVAEEPAVVDQRLELIEPAVTGPVADSAQTPAESPMAVSAKTEPALSTPADVEEGLKALFPVAKPAPPAVEPGIYVQHASFRLPQSALIWQSNNSQLPGVKVATKGERFVTVSGPFIDRGQAVQYLAEFGITARPYFISGDMLSMQSRI